MRGGASGTLPLKQNGAAAGQGRHRRVVCVMNAPTCLDLTLSPEGSPSYDNPARFFANSMRHSLTIANFAKALHHLDRSSVIGVDMLPLAMPGTDVGVNADSKQSQDAARWLVDVLEQIGLTFVLVTGDEPWTTLRRAIEPARCESLRCVVQIGPQTFVTVELLAFATGRRVLFFIKGAHFSMWLTHRLEIVAALVCLFEMAGQRVRAANVKNLLES